MHALAILGFWTAVLGGSFLLLCLGGYAWEWVQKHDAVLLVLCTAGMIFAAVAGYAVISGVGQLTDR